MARSARGNDADDRPEFSLFEVYPGEVRAIVDIELRSQLVRCRNDLGMHKAYLGFIDADGLVHYPQSLRVQEDTFAFNMRYNLGIVGLAITEDDIYCWPDDAETPRWHQCNDPKAVGEIAGPLHHAGKPTGTIWFATHDPMRRFQANEREVLLSHILEIDRILRETYELWSQGADDRLLTLAQDCLKRTASDRGYIAIEKPDKDLQYFLVGKDTDQFVMLTRFEGLCGRAFKTSETINCENVLDDSSYRPSHLDVQSELVVPIVEDVPGAGRRSIGLINLESYNLAHYTKFREHAIRVVAQQEARLAQIFRKREATRKQDTGERIKQRILNGLVGFVQTVASPIFGDADSGESAASSFPEALRECARQLTGRSRTFWVDAGGTLPPSCFEIDQTREARAAPAFSQPVAVPVVHEGEVVGHLGIEFEPDDDDFSEIVDHLKLTARLGAATYKLNQRAERNARTLALIEGLVDRPGDFRTILDIVRELPLILESRHCTIFLRYDVNGRLYLVPGPSSSSQLTATSISGRLFYNWSAEDGATAFAAATNRPVILTDIGNASERREVSPALSWGKILAEEPGSQTKAFLAFPIVAPGDPGHVLGVIRTYRDRYSKRTRFSDQETRIFGVFAHLLGRALRGIVPTLGMSAPIRREQLAATPG